MTFLSPPGFYGSHRGATGEPPDPTGDPGGTSGKVRSLCWEGFGEVMSGYLLLSLVAIEKIAVELSGKYVSGKYV